MENLDEAGTRSASVSTGGGWMANGTQLTHVESVACVAGTFGLFILINLLMGLLLRTFSATLREHWNFWRFKNTCLSWTHSLTATTLVLINMYYRWDLFEDMMYVRSRFAYLSICVSIGYFVYDAADILYSNKKLKTQSYEVLLHHVIILITFSIPLYTGLFIGYTVTALSIEFNTIFLHLRFMFVFHEYDKRKLIYRVISTANLVTFVLFRILTLCWMTRWVVVNRHQIHVAFVAVGSFGLLVMMIINFILLNRLITSDFRSPSSSSGALDSKSSSTSNVNEKLVSSNGAGNGGLNNQSSSSLTNGIRASVAANTIVTHSKFD